MVFKRLLCRWQLTAAWLLLSSLSGFASEQHHFTAATPATLQRISTSEGLSQGTINHFFQDKTGFIWLSTAEGLNVYNGYSVRPFEHSSASFNGAYIYFVTQDRTGLYWISVSEHGLYSFNASTNELQLHWASAEDYERDVLTFHSDEETNSTWFFTSNSILSYSHAQQQFSEEPQELENFVDEQFITSSANIAGDIWLGTNKGLVRYSANNGSTQAIEFVTVASSSQSNVYQQRVRQLVKDKYDRLWVATANGLFVLENEQLLSAGEGESQQLFVKPLVPNLQFHDLILEDERILAASNKGLLAIDLDSLQRETLLQFSNSNQDIYNDRIIKLFRDKNQNYWLASNARGAYLWNPKTEAFSNYYNSGRGQKILSSNEVWDIEETSPNQLWLGTSNGLTHLDLNQNTSEFWFMVDDQEGLLSQVYQIQQRAENELWLATSEGIKRFDFLAKQQIPVRLADEKQRAIFADQQSFLFVDSKERIWLSTLDSFYLYMPDSGTLTELTNLKVVINPYFSFGFIGEIPGTDTMILSVSGQIWGVDTRSFEPRLIYELENYSPQEFVYVDSWTLDPQNGLVWFSFTSQGLVALNYEDFSLAKQTNHLKSAGIGVAYGLLQDSNRRVWFSSHRGIFNLGLDNAHLMNFDLSYGLAALEYNGGAWKKLRSGQMVYGGVKGITLFNPDNIGVGTDPHKQVVIDDFNIANRDTPVTFSNLAEQVFELDYNDAGIHISFSTLGFEQQQQVQYQYSLQGRELTEYPLTYANEARFSQLASGTYEFTVRAISPVTGFSTRPSKIVLNVAYAPWNSPWARLSYVLLLLCILAAFIYRRRIKQRVILAMNKELVDSEQRLRLALKSSQSEPWEWSDKDRLIRYVGIVGYDAGKQEQTFRQHCLKIHPDDRSEFMREWKTLFDSASVDAFTFTYRMRQADNSYHWFRNVGQILERNPNGQPRLISGLFTDVNEAQTAAASALVFGEAFRNTKDWVLIIDSDFNGVMANNSFYKAFNYAPESQISLGDDVFRGLGSKMRKYRQIMEQMGIGEHWHGEDSIEVRDKGRCQVLINISLISIENREKNHYVVIFTDITQQKNAEEELKLLANYDALTLLPNRTLLLDRIEHAIQVADRNRNTLALLFVDLDRFKQINDSLGHDYGDKLLQVVANRLKERVRKQDTVARLGGDEFVVLLESFQNVSHVGEVALELSACIAEPIELCEHSVSITPSIGIALYPSDARLPEDLLRDADIAMFHAKKDPGKCYHFYTESMDTEVRNRLQKESLIKRAHASQEFVNYYQPILDANTGQVVGAELLLRWVTKDGIVPPNVFIPMAEQIGLIIPMTNDALRRGLTDTQHWRTNIPDFYLSINLSVTHFEQDGVAEGMVSLLHEFGLPASALKVEVTESALMSHPEKAITTMERFQALGVQLSLDDFGTGYSSFAYLKRLPLNIVKLDRSFVAGIGTDKKDETIVEAILGLAQNLGLQVVAEGVETEQHSEFLRTRTCQFFQGFYYARPMGRAEFDGYLQANLSHGET
ncbi:EAL domain-containing protein [Planctobacterium marinum]|uniref:EAL domain-containing protein n=1 Tax=Planctobacterium marinum TaxID=1631968 RepID=UPI001E2924FD|nr:EAL domain-containing protein [Planctobacterium marinum]MCC2608201.1 EAL domain-containing protein [Planctobacterium marinum]